MLTLMLGVLTTVVSGLLGWFVQTTIKENRELKTIRQKEDVIHREAQNQGLVSLLRVSLIDYHEKYTSEGYIPRYARENWDKMYTSYHTLGGNGMADGMDRDIRDLPYKKKQHS